MATTQYLHEESGTPITKESFENILSFYREYSVNGPLPTYLRYNAVVNEAIQGHNLPQEIVDRIESFIQPPGYNREIALRMVTDEHDELCEKSVKALMTENSQIDPRGNKKALISIASMVFSSMVRIYYLYND